MRQTPLWQLSGRAMSLDCAQVWLKLEHLQVGGSFKARGMLNRMLAQPIPAAGVVIASGGNAGIAAAAAAQALGVPCEVFVSAVSSQAKRDRLRQLGAAVTVAGEGYTQAYEACLARQQASGALLMHAYDQVEVVAGAATLGAEIEAPIPEDRCEEVVTGQHGDPVAEVREQFGVRIAQFDKNSRVRVEFPDTRHGMD